MIKKHESGRGMLTESVKKMSLDFLGREITTRELRLYPYIDFTLKNDFTFDMRKINEEEIEILDMLMEESHLVYNREHLVVTKAFYDYIQIILFETYVIEYLEN